MLDERSLTRGLEVAAGELASMRHWYPVALEPDTLRVAWRHLGAHRFTEPFFEDSLAAQPRPQRRVCHTPLSALEDLPAHVPPTAFIFHVSRCGSTLLTQMLATLPSCIALSEPPVLDAFFRLHHRQPARSGGVQTFRRLVAALGQRRDSAERHLVIKLDSWHMPWMPFVREAFPQTPIVLLYRAPQAVLDSHRRQRGPQMVPGLVDVSRLRVDARDLAPGDLDGYTRRVLDAVFGAALEAWPGVQPLLMDYTQLPQAAWELLAPAWSMDLSEGERALLRARSAYHAKTGSAVFQGDPPPRGEADEKKDRPWEAVRLHERLEAARLSCATGRSPASR